MVQPFDVDRQMIDGLLLGGKQDRIGHTLILGWLILRPQNRKTRNTQNEPNNTRNQINVLYMADRYNSGSSKGTIGSLGKHLGSVEDDGGEPRGHLGVEPDLDPRLDLVFALHQQVEHFLLQKRTRQKIRKEKKNRKEKKEN